MPQQIFHADQIVASDPPAKSGSPTPSPSTSGFETPEAWNQIKNFGKGVADTISTVYHLAQGDPEAAHKTVEGIKETFAAPGRELMGQAQPGYPEESKPRGPLDRLVGAGLTMMGGDPGKARVLEAQGKPWQAAQAYGTIPLLTYGLGKLFEGKIKDYQSSSSASAAGKLKRAEMLTAATGEGQKKIAELYHEVLPDLDKTIKATGKHPQSTTDLVHTMDDTMGRIESEYQNLLGTIGGRTVFPQSVADAIRSKIKSHMLPGGSTAETEAMGEALERRAKEWEKSFSLDSLDNHRKYLFTVDKDSAAGRLKERTSADLIADKAAHDALNDLVYGEVQAEATKAGLPLDYVRNAKKMQAILYDLTDTLKPQDVRLANREAMRQGTPWTQRTNITVAGHPESGKLVSSIHGVSKAVLGNPASKATADKLVRKTFPGKPPGSKASVAATSIAAGSQSRKGIQVSQDESTVMMKAPDGSTRAVPKEEVSHWKTKGAVVVQ